MAGGGAALCNGNHLIPLSATWAVHFRQPSRNTTPNLTLIIFPRGCENSYTGSSASAGHECCAQAGELEAFPRGKMIQEVEGYFVG